MAMRNGLRGGEMKEGGEANEEMAHWPRLLRLVVAGCLRLSLLFGEFY